MTRPVPTNLLYDSEEPDRELTERERGLVAGLTAEDLTAIDEALLRRTGVRWRKVAALVGDALTQLEHRLPDLPDVYFGQRVRELVESGVLESEGNLARMRFSEVRLVVR